MLEKEYLFKRFESEASYWHYVCYKCGYEDMHLNKNEEKDEISKYLNRGES